MTREGRGEGYDAAQRLCTRRSAAPVRPCLSMLAY
jgi:hypothetical protein